MRQGMRNILIVCACIALGEIYITIKDATNSNFVLTTSIYSSITLVVTTFLIGLAVWGIILLAKRRNSNTQVMTEGSKTNAKLSELKGLRIFSIAFISIIFIMLIANLFYAGSISYVIGTLIGAILLIPILVYICSGTKVLKIISVILSIVVIGVCIWAMVNIQATYGVRTSTPGLVGTIACSFYILGMIMVLVYILGQAKQVSVSTPQSKNTGQPHTDIEATKISIKVCPFCNSNICEDAKWCPKCNSALG